MIDWYEVDYAYFVYNVYLKRVRVQTCTVTILYMNRRKFKSASLIIPMRMFYM